MGWLKNRTGLKAIYLMHSLQGFAFSLIGIFIPIYLLTLNYQVSQVLIFYIFHYLFLAAFAFLAAYVASRIGLQRTIIIRFPFTFIYLGLLFSLKDLATPLPFIALFSGLESALYWIPLHILFTKNSNKEELGDSTGKLFALPQIMGLLAPLIGGLLATLFGFKFLIGTVIILLLLSVLPLFKFSSAESFAFSGKMLVLPQLVALADSVYHRIVDALPIKTRFNFQPARGKELYKKYKKYFWAEIFDNIGEETEAIIWPIFIYLNLLNVASVGLVGTLLSLGSILVTLIIGKTADRISKIKLIKLGAFLLAMTWLARYFFASQPLYFVMTIVSGFFTALFLVAYTSKLYGLAKADESLTDEFFVFREIPVALGRISVLVIALIFINNFNVTFLVSGLSYFYFLVF